MRHKLTLAERLKGARKLVKLPSVKRKKAFHASLKKFIAKHR